MLDALLSCLQSSASSKNGVTEVTGVTPSNHGPLRCNPEKIAGVTRVTNPASAGGAVTPVTPCNPAGVTPKPAPIGACTLVTPVTPQNIKAESEAQKVGAGETAQPFDAEAFEERAAICEFDGGLSRDEAEAVAWREDDRRRCCHCLELLPNGICKVASPSGPVVANRGYRPADILRRCEGYRPCPDDPDRRHGRERWPGLIQKGGER